MTQTWLRAVHSSGKTFLRARFSSQATPAVQVARFDGDKSRFASAGSMPEHSATT